MPALSPTMEEGTIAEWLVKEGSSVKTGDIIARVQTDKSNVDWEAMDDTILAKILVGENQTVAVGQPVAIACETEDEIEQAQKQEPGVGAPKSQEPQSSEKPQESQEAQPSSQGLDLPEFKYIKMGALSPTGDENKLASFSVKIGDEIKEEQIIGSVETDKTNVDWPSTDEGFLAKILFDVGEVVKIGEPVMILVDSKDDVGKFQDISKESLLGQIGGDQQKGQAEQKKQDQPQQKKEEQTQKDKPQQSQKQQQKAPQQPTNMGGQRVKISPYAKKLAQEKGIDFTQLKGSDPEGRIVAADIENAKQQGVGQGAPQKQTAGAPEVGFGEYMDINVDNIKKVTAKRLLQSKQTIPHYYITQEINVDQLMSLRKQFNAQLEKQGLKISVNDFIIKAASMANKTVPAANSQWMDSFIREFQYVDMGMAVATSKGLLVPVIRDTDVKGLKQIAQESKELAKKAKDGKLSTNDMSGSTFTISNMGMYGITHFSAVINPPNSCILAVGGTDKKLYLKKDGTIGEVTIMRTTLSCDHRVIDGALGAEWITAFKQLMENPQSMLL